MKSELIIIGENCQENSIVKNLHNLIHIAQTFFQQYLSVKIIKTTEEHNSFDIVEETTGIELGSYGIRQYKNPELEYDFTWIYGTGCAEPRLSSIIRKIKPIGYHQMIIPKQSIGTIGKIHEELDELTDCELTGNKIMSLMELSDLYGAIEMYLHTNFPSLEMTDLAKMSKTTKRVFKNGIR
jgi:hypothetical protein